MKQTSEKFWSTREINEDGTLGHLFAGSTSKDKEKATDAFARIRGDNIGSGRTFALVETEAVYTRTVLVKRRMAG